MNCLDFYDFRFYGFILWVVFYLGKSVSTMFENLFENILDTDLPR